MPPKDNMVYIGHILETIQKAEKLLSGKSRSDFDNDETLFLALAHLIQMIGESARRLQKEFCDANPDIPWKAIVGMRNKVVHDYMDIDGDILWETVTKELTPLKNKLKAVR